MAAPMGVLAVVAMVAMPGVAVPLRVVVIGLLRYGEQTLENYSTVSKDILVKSCQ